MSFVGHYLHSGFGDCLEMEIEELEYFYKIALKLNQK
jgi:hypothetical protein